MVDVVIGSEPITYAGADHADVLVLLSQGAADRHGAGGRRGGVVIADGTQVKAPPPGALCLPITELARTHTGSPIAAGVVSLGCVAAIADAVSFESLALSVKEHVPDAFVEANLAACAAGHAAMHAALNGGGDE
jgi:Pyruvate/2-oxoacid:ferredoxin oxidoreductase gamma subunit